jgi:uncharacterized protein YceK
MKAISIVALTVIASLMTSGCGTILNLRSGDPDVYGGVQKDWKFFMTPVFDGAGCSGEVFFPLIVAADAGLSLIADTLTLPLVIRMRHEDQEKEDATNSAGCKGGQTTRPSEENASPGKL